MIVIFPRCRLPRRRKSAPGKKQAVRRGKHPAGRRRLQYPFVCSVATPPESDYPLLFFATHLQGQAFSASGATARQHSAPAFGAHAGAEAVIVDHLSVRWLVCTFHMFFPGSVPLEFSKPIIIRKSLLLSSPIWITYGTREPAASRGPHDEL
jgi:hypothetical protein